MIVLSTTHRSCGCSNRRLRRAGGLSGGAAPTAGTDLMTASTSLGDIVVDGKGMRVYMFDKDKQHATSSACSGDCATA